MITWIQTVLQKHHNIVFGILLIAIIIAFVFTIGSVPFFGDSYSHSASREKKEFCGYDLKNEGVMGFFQNCAYYEIILNGVQLQNQQQLEMFVLRQMYLSSLAKELGLRQVTPQELENYIQTRPVFQSKDGSFDVDVWNKFKNDRLSSGRMSDENLTTIMAQNALVEKVAGILGGPGYVLPNQIEREYKLVNGKWDLCVAELSFADFKPEVKTDAKALENHFKNNVEAYRIGEGVTVEAVYMPMKDFAALVKTPNDEDLKVFFASNMKRYAESKDGKVQLPTFEQSKGKVLVDYISEAAQIKARQAGEDVAQKIYDSGAKINSAELKKVLDGMKITTKKIGDVRLTDETLPKDFPAQVASAAVRLTPDQFYSDPIITDDGVWVVIISGKLPSYLPTFEQVKGKVEKDFLANEKQKLFYEKANTLVKSLKTGVEGGKNFADIAKAGGAKIQDINGFSLGKPSGAGLEIYSVLRSQLPKMKVGSVSDMQTMGEKGYIVFVKKAEVPVVKGDSAELASIKKNSKEALSSLSASSVIGEKISGAMKNDEEK